MDFHVLLAKFDFIFLVVLLEKTMAVANALVNYTNFFYQKYGHFVKSLERDRSNISLDSTAQGEHYFQYCEEKKYRKSLRNILLLVSEIYDFNMSKRFDI